jgi:transposase
LLQIFYSVRSERLLMEQLSYNLLFRWFVAWKWMNRFEITQYSARIRERLLNQELAQEFFQRVLQKPSLACRTSASRSRAP